MVLQKGIDIHLGLPATGYPSAGKHVILETAEPKIDIAANPGASNRFFVVLLDHSLDLPRYNGCTHRVQRIVPVSAPLKNQTIWCPAVQAISAGHFLANISGYEGTLGSSACAFFTSSSGKA